MDGTATAGTYVYRRDHVVDVKRWRDAAQTGTTIMNELFGEQKSQSLDTHLDDDYESWE